MRNTFKKIKPADMSECPDCLQPTSKQELIDNYGFCTDCLEYLVEKGLIDLEELKMDKQ